MKNLFYLLLAVMTFCLAACDKRQSVTYELEPFECVNLFAFGETDNLSDTKAEVEFTQGDNYQISVLKSATDSIRWYSENNTLYVIVFSHKNPKLSLTAPYFKSIECSNIHNIEINDTLKQSCLDLSAVGAVHSKMNLDIDTLNLKMDAYKKVKLVGRCDTASVMAQNSHPFAKFDAQELQVNNMQIACGVAGTHTCLNVINHLWITDGLNSKIDYLGNPEIMQANIRLSILRGN